MTIASMLCRCVRYNNITTLLFPIGNFELSLMWTMNKQPVWGLKYVSTELLLISVFHYEKTGGLALILWTIPFYLRDGKYKFM